MPIQNQCWMFLETVINIDRDEPGVYELGAARQTNRLQNSATGVPHKKGRNERQQLNRSRRISEQA